MNTIRLFDDLDLPVSIEWQFPSTVVKSHRNNNNSNSQAAAPVLSFMSALRKHHQTRLPPIHPSQKVPIQMNPFTADAGDHSLQKLLDCSDEFFPELTANEQVKSSHSALRLSTLATAPILPVLTNSSSSCAQSSNTTTTLLDLEFAELEDPPLTCNGDELPVAEALIKHVDLFFNNSKKRAREMSQDEQEEDEEEEDGGDIDETEEGSNFSQEEARSSTSLDDQWTERFRELCDFKGEKGHCNVPHNYKGNPVLARWVKRQRHQYKQLKLSLDDGCHLPKTIKERLQALQDLGFIFQCQRTAWDEKFADLLQYRKEHLDCNVPSNYPENQALAMWVKCQRRQYKMFKEGRKSGMTQDRLQQLEGIGFTWGLRKYNKKPRAEC